MQLYYRTLVIGTGTLYVRIAYVPLLQNFSDWYVICAYCICITRKFCIYGCAYYTHTGVLCNHMYAHIYTYTHIYTYVHIYTHMYTCVHIYTHIYTNMRITGMAVAGARHCPRSTVLYVPLLQNFSTSELHIT